MDRRLRFVGHAAEDGERRLAVERMLAGRGFIKHAAEAEEVRAMIDGLAVGLFGGHVERRAGDEPGAREPHIFEAAGQAEVGQFHAVADFFDQDVARLDVAVDEPAGVGGREPGGGLLPELRHIHGRELAHALQPLFQRFAHHQLHHEIRQARRVIFIHLINGDEVIVRDRCGSAGLAAEPLPRHVVIRQLRVEHLHRYVSLQVRIVALQHDAHPTAADDALDVEDAEPADEGRIARGLQEFQIEVAGGNRLGSGGRVAVPRVVSRGCDFECHGRERRPHRGMARRSLLTAGANHGREQRIATRRERLHAILAASARADVFRENGGASLRNAIADQPLEFAGLRTVSWHGSYPGRSCFFGPHLHVVFFVYHLAHRISQPRQHPAFGDVHGTGAHL